MKSLMRLLRLLDSSGREHCHFLYKIVIDQSRLFISPIILPRHPAPLPPTIPPRISSITSSAHPLLHSHSLSCAVLHPSTPSCLYAFLTQMLTSAPTLLRFFTVIFSALSVLSYKRWRAAPVATLNALSKQILKMTFIISSAIGTAWSSICLFQNFLPRKLIPQWRFFLGGFLGGLFMYFDRQRGRGLATYAARTSADSLWKVGVKRRWWKDVKGGDVFVFAVSLGMMGVVLEKNKQVGKGWERMTLEVIRGDRELGLGARDGKAITTSDSIGSKTATPTSDGKEIPSGSEEGDWQNVAGKDSE